MHTQDHTLCHTPTHQVTNNAHTNQDTPDSIWNRKHVRSMLEDAKVWVLAGESGALGTTRSNYKKVNFSRQHGV